MSLLKPITDLLLITLSLASAAIQASDANRNRTSASNCRTTSKEYKDVVGQRTAHCQCLARELCDRYPEQCQIFHLKSNRPV